MARRFGGTALVAVAMMFGLACAEGMPGPDEFSSSLRKANPMPVTGAGSSAPSPMNPPPAFMGTPCAPGSRAMCTCADGVSIGIQVCRDDMQSPSGGALSACEACMAPAMPPAGMAGGAAGASGASGSGGSASGGSGGSASGGSGGSGSGGMTGGMSGGGRGGSGGSGGSSMTMCDADDCPGTTGLFGIEREPCCTRGGECGGINALSGNCEEG
jgi:hypothetical protein